VPGPNVPCFREWMILSPGVAEQIGQGADQLVGDCITKGEGAAERRGNDLSLAKQHGILG